MLSFILIENSNQNIAPDSDKVSTSSSVYESSKKSSENKSQWGITGKEVTIEDLHKQQLELIKMQALIQEKMQHLQNAISKRESRTKDEKKSISTFDLKSYRNKKNQLTSLLQFDGKSSHNESSQWIKVRPDSYVLPKTDSRNKNGQKWLFNKNSSALVSDTATNSTINDWRSKSNLKKRRTRREREASIENSTNQNESKHLNDKVKIENNDYVVFNENDKSLNYMRIKDRNSRTAIWSIERNNLNNESFMSQINTKAQNIDKNAQLIAKKTFEALAKVRPTQSTVRCIRFFVLVLKCFNNKLTSISEYGTWTVLLWSILSNLGVILKEIKLLSKRCSALETAHQIIDEMNSRLFINTDKSLPSWSKAFQKECKPIANLLQSIVCYYEIKDKSIDDRSNNSAIFQSNDQSYQNIVNNQSTHMKTLSNFDMDQVENTKTRYVKFYI